MTKICSECFTLHNELRVLYMTKLTVSLTILLATILSSIALVATPPVFSTTEDSGSESESESEDLSEEETQEEETEPETESEDTPPAQTDEPPVPAEPLTPEAALTPEPEPEVIECKEGYVLENEKCVLDPLTKLGDIVGPPKECLPEQGLTPLECLDKVVTPPVEETPLPPCDGSPQDCVTPNGDICLEGQGGHECECAEDMSDCPNHPSLTPLESPSPEKQVLPYCDKVEDDPTYTGGCHDREDYDELTGLYPCNDGSQEEDWRDCEDTYVPPLPPCHPDAVEASASTEREPECQAPENEPGKNYDPRLEDVEDLSCEDVEGTVKVIGTKDPYGLDRDGDGIGCEANENGNGGGGDKDKDITIVVNKIIKETNNNHHHESFPEIDIIGLSTKQNGDSMVCLINIDEEHVQCQEFGMASDRVNGDFWRVIETDHDKDYDNGNTGSNDINGVIEDIKSQDFSELDDATNHDFGIDISWIAINPQGEGAVCLSEDSTGKGKSLCEPFKVSSKEISGQITEGVAITS